MKYETLGDVIAACHQTAVSKGWWESGDRNFGELIALCHTELSEAFEEYRTHGLSPEWMLYNGIDPATDPPTPRLYSDDKLKTEGIAAELADVLIRIFDFCEYYKIPLATALDAKMRFNESRPYRHGGKKA